MTKFLLIILVVFFLFPIVVRYLFRLFIQDQYRKAQNQFYQEQKKQTRRQRDGEIKVDYTPPQKDHLKGGEYIEYEEVKDWFWVYGKPP